MNEWIISFANLEHFYSSNPARRFSPEAGYGVHWRLDRWEGSWRVCYVRETGEVYALRGSGPLLVLGVFPIDPDAGPCDVYYRGLDQHLEGWPEQCGGPDSLAWLIGKMTQASPDTVHTHLWGTHGNFPRS